MIFVFTGIIEGTGKVTKVTKSAGRNAVNLSVELGSGVRGLRIGQSVALNGVCLTVTSRSRGLCGFEVIDETLQLSALGELRRGSDVNFERSLRAGGRLEGHFVLGHVDGVGTIKKIQSMPGEVRMWVEIPAGLAKYVVKKGSIALDGISLTVAQLRGSTAMVCLVPHTVRITNIRSKKKGDPLNIETDILGKYARK